ncbi:hypothetical protein [Streptomyces sp. NPDC005969]
MRPVTCRRAGRDVIGDQPVQEQFEPLVHRAVVVAPQILGLLDEAVVG